MKKLFLFLMLGSFIYTGIQTCYANSNNSRFKLDYNQGRINLSAQDASLLSLLKAFTEKTGVRFYVASQTETKKVSLQLKDISLKQALKRILRGYNHAMLLSKVKQNWKITSVQIYPQGKIKGSLELVKTEQHALETSPVGKKVKRIFVSADPKVSTTGQLKQRGLLTHSRTLPDSQAEVSKLLNKPWFVTQKQLEAEEQLLVQEIILEKEKKKAMQDPIKKKALSIAHTQAVHDFFKRKKANLNRIEALRRMQTYKEMTENEK